MNPRSPYTDTLRTAAEAVGGEEALATRLGVPEEDLHAWLAGSGQPPLAAFLDALDVIADGPYRRQRRRVRVAVLRDDAIRTTN
jgi:hypothetical protein